MLTTIIFCIGLFFVLKFIITILWEILKEFLPWDANLDRYGRKQGRWAVITGGTDGIGLGFCQTLAQMGWNVCIISRNSQKLQSTIQTLTQSLLSQKITPPSFKSITADFTQGNSPEFFYKIRDELKDCNIGILVNNVGTSDIKKFGEFQLNRIIDIVNVNCISMVGVTSVLLPKLRESRSAIINLSSYLGQNSCPYSTLYSATKAFNTYFSQSLCLQSQLSNIDILSVRPMFVQSPLSKKKKAFTVPDRKQCARACLRQLQWEYQTNGYLVHRILGILFSNVGKRVRRVVSAGLARREMGEYYLRE